jgi:membrane protein required for colicin V production
LEFEDWILDIGFYNCSMIIDITFAILIALACFKGYKKGLIVALFSFFGLVIGLAAALKLSAVVADHLKNSINIAAKWLPFLSFILVFIIVVLLVRLGAKLIEKTLEAALLGWANRLGGILLYALVYTIILSIFLFYSEKINLLKQATIKDSICYSFIEPWGPTFIEWFGKLIPAFKDIFAQLENFFASFQQKPIS